LPKIYQRRIFKNMSLNSRLTQGLLSSLQQATAQAQNVSIAPQAQNVSIAPQAQNISVAPQTPSTLPAAAPQKPSTLPAAAPQKPSTLPAAAPQKPATLPANVSQIPSDFPPSTPVGMCYVPFQQWETLLAENIGFEAGTIFPSLVLPFSASKGCAVT
jgi:hypothetical protein